MEKVCIICFQNKPLSEYYVHNRMGDGHLNKCKQCTKIQSKERHHTLKQDPEWLEKERTRGREKAKRLGCKKPTSEAKRLIMKRYYEKYPEKKSARIALEKVRVKGSGIELHHWSYNQEHYTDVIELQTPEHGKLHRFIIYDQERMMYRRYDNNELLDTKDKHFQFYMETKNLPD